MHVEINSLYAPSGPHQQFCAQGFLSCFSCLCIVCVQTSPISFVAGNCLYSLRNKRFRVVSEERKTEERRGTTRNEIFGLPHFSCGL